MDSSNNGKNKELNPDEIVVELAGQGLSDQFEQDRLEANNLLANLLHQIDDLNFFDAQDLTTIGFDEKSPFLNPHYCEKHKEHPEVSDLQRICQEILQAADQHNELSQKREAFFKRLNDTQEHCERIHKKKKITAFIRESLKTLVADKKISLLTKNQVVEDLLFLLQSKDIEVPGTLFESIPEDTAISLVAEMMEHAGVSLNRSKSRAPFKTTKKSLLYINSLVKVSRSLSPEFLARALKSKLTKKNKSLFSTLSGKTTPFIKSTFAQISLISPEFQQVREVVEEHVASKPEEATIAAIKSLKEAMELLQKHQDTLNQLNDKKQQHPDNEPVQNQVSHRLNEVGEQLMRQESLITTLMNNITEILLPAIDDCSKAPGLLEDITTISSQQISNPDISKARDKVIISLMAFSGDSLNKLELKAQRELSRALIRMLISRPEAWSNTDHGLLNIVLAQVQQSSDALLYGLNDISTMPVTSDQGLSLSDDSDRKSLLRLIATLYKENSDLDPQRVSSVLSCCVQDPPSYQEAIACYIKALVESPIKNDTSQNIFLPIFHSHICSITTELSPQKFAALIRDISQEYRSTLLPLIAERLHIQDSEDLIEVLRVLRFSELEHLIQSPGAHGNGLSHYFEEKNLEAPSPEFLEWIKATGKDHFTEVRALSALRLDDHAEKAQKKSASVLRYSICSWLSQRSNEHQAEFVESLLSTNFQETLDLEYAQDPHSFKKLLQTIAKTPDSQALLLRETFSIIAQGYIKDFKPGHSAALADYYKKQLGQFSSKESGEKALFQKEILTGLENVIRLRPELQEPLQPIFYGIFSDHNHRRASFEDSEAARSKNLSIMSQLASATQKTVEKGQQVLSRKSLAQSHFSRTIQPLFESCLSDQKLQNFVKKQYLIHLLESSEELKGGFLLEKFEQVLNYLNSEQPEVLSSEATIFEEFVQALKESLPINNPSRKWAMYFQFIAKGSEELEEIIGHKTASEKGLSLIDILTHGLEDPFEKMLEVQKVLNEVPSSESWTERFNHMFLRKSHDIQMRDILNKQRNNLRRCFAELQVQYMDTLSEQPIPSIILARQAQDLHALSPELAKDFLSQLNDGNLFPISYGACDSGNLDFSALSSSHKITEYLIKALQYEPPTRSQIFEESYALIQDSLITHNDQIHLFAALKAHTPEGVSEADFDEMKELILSTQEKSYESRDLNSLEQDIKSLNFVDDKMTQELYFESLKTEISFLHNQGSLTSLECWTLMKKLEPHAKDLSEFQEARLSMGKATILDNFDLSSAVTVEMQALHQKIYPGESFIDYLMSFEECFNELGCSHQEWNYAVSQNLAACLSMLQDLRDPPYHPAYYIKFLVTGEILTTGSGVEQISASESTVLQILSALYPQLSLPQSLIQFKTHIEQLQFFYEFQGFSESNSKRNQLITQLIESTSALQKIYPLESLDAEKCNMSLETPHKLDSYYQQVLNADKSHIPQKAYALMNAAKRQSPAKEYRHLPPVVEAFSLGRAIWVMTKGEKVSAAQISKFISLTPEQEKIVDAQLQHQYQCHRPEANRDYLETFAQEAIGKTKAFSLMHQMSRGECDLSSPEVQRNIVTAMQEYSFDNLPLALCVHSNAGNQSADHDFRSLMNQYWSVLQAPETQQRMEMQQRQRLVGFNPLNRLGAQLEGFLDLPDLERDIRLLSGEELYNKVNNSVDELCQPENLYFSLVRYKDYQKRQEFFSRIRSSKSSSDLFALQPVVWIYEAHQEAMNSYLSSKEPQNFITESLKILYDAVSLDASLCHIKVETYQKACLIISEIKNLFESEGVSLSTLESKIIDLSGNALLGSELSSEDKQAVTRKIISSLQDLLENNGSITEDGLDAIAESFAPTASEDFQNNVREVLYQEIGDLKVEQEHVEQRSQEIVDAIQSALASQLNHLSNDDAINTVLSSRFTHPNLNQVFGTGNQKARMIQKDIAKSLLQQQSSRYHAHVAQLKLGREQKELVNQLQLCNPEDLSGLGVTSLPRLADRYAEQNPQERFSQIWQKEFAAIYAQRYAVNTLSLEYAARYVSENDPGLTSRWMSNIVATIPKKKEQILFLPWASRSISYIKEALLRFKNFFADQRGLSLSIDKIFNNIGFKRDQSGKKVVSVSTPEGFAQKIHDFYKHFQEQYKKIPSEFDAAVHIASQFDQGVFFSQEEIEQWRKDALASLDCVYEATKIIAEMEDYLQNASPEKDHQGAIAQRVAKQELNTAVNESVDCANNLIQLLNNKDFLTLILSSDGEVREIAVRDAQGSAVVLEDGCLDSISETFIDDRAFIALHQRIQSLIETLKERVPEPDYLYLCNNLRAAERSCEQFIHRHATSRNLKFDNGPNSYYSEWESERVRPISEIVANLSQQWSGFSAEKELPSQDQLSQLIAKHKLACRMLEAFIDPSESLEQEMRNIHQSMVSLASSACEKVPEIISQTTSKNKSDKQKDLLHILSTLEELMKQLPLDSQEIDEVISVIEKVIGHIRSSPISFIALNQRIPDLQDAIEAIQIQKKDLSVKDDLSEQSSAQSLSDSMSTLSEEILELPQDYHDLLNLFNQYEKLCDLQIHEQQALETLLKNSKEHDSAAESIELLSESLWKLNEAVIESLLSCCSYLNEQVSARKKLNAEEMNQVTQSIAIGIKVLSQQDADDINSQRFQTLMGQVSDLTSLFRERGYISANTLSLEKALYQKELADTDPSPAGVAEIEEMENNTAETPKKAKSVYSGKTSEKIAGDKKKDPPTP